MAEEHLHHDLKTCMEILHSLPVGVLRKVASENTLYAEYLNPIIDEKMEGVTLGPRRNESASEFSKAVMTNETFRKHHFGDSELVHYKDLYNAYRIYCHEKEKKRMCLAQFRMYANEIIPRQSERRRFIYRIN